MINNPKGDVLNLPPDILATTPFTDFKMPGILLTVMVGLPGLVSVFYYIQDNMRKSIPTKSFWPHDKKT